MIPSTPAVAEPKTLSARTSEKLNPSQRKKAAKERAKLTEKMKAKYGPTPTTIDHVVASLVPDTDTQPTIYVPHHELWLECTACFLQLSNDYLLSEKSAFSEVEF